MNENLQSALTELINSSLAALETASNFLVAEIPDVVFQLLLWYGVKSGLTFTVGLIFLALIIFTGYKVVKNVRFQLAISEGKRSEFLVFWLPLGYALLTLVVGIPGVLATMTDLEWLQIAIAPKIWLIEYAANFAQRM